VTHLILENDHRATTPVYSSFISGLVDSPEYNFLEMVKKNISSSDLEILLNDINLGGQRISLMMKNPHYFYPDGIHPNERAHKIIFEFLLTAIPELKC
jgi:lysophospholipase L1-like esterase